MTYKDLTVQATDRIAEALKALTRINYDNAQQCADNQMAAAQLLKEAVDLLETEVE